MKTGYIFLGVLFLMIQVSGCTIIQTHNTNQETINRTALMEAEEAVITTDTAKTKLETAMLRTQLNEAEVKLNDESVKLKKIKNDIQKSGNEQLKNKLDELLSRIGKYENEIAYGGAQDNPADIKKKKEKVEQLNKDIDNYLLKLQKIEIIHE